MPANTERSPLMDSALAESLPALRRFLSSKVQRQEDVDDLVQETLERSLKSVGERTLSNPVAYAMTTAKSVLFDRWRKEKAELEAEFNFDSLVDENSTVATRVEQQQSLQQIEAIIAKMPKLRREVFVRRRLEGQSREAIAQALDISLESVKKHISRALVDLAEALDVE